MFLKKCFSWRKKSDNVGFVRRNITTIAVFVTIVLVVGMVFILENTDTTTNTANTTKETTSEFYGYTETEEKINNTEAVEQTQSPEESDIPKADKSVSEEVYESVSAVSEEEILYDTDDAVLQAEDAVTEYIEPVAENTSVPKVEKTETCEISIYCTVLLDNIDKLSRNKRSLVPPDGCILKSEVVEIENGDSVFDILKRATQKNKIHMEYVNTPIYNSAYIEGINNLYEFDGGELSGWMYCVNGEFPDYGCSGYTVKAGDVIEWHYSCDLGRDVNGNTVFQKEE